LPIEHFFEMSKTDAERALKIYRAFVKQTEQVVRYLSIARHYDHATRLEIPKIKHAPTSLTGSLEEYLKDPDFDVNRRQYLAQQQAKKSGKPTNGASKLPAAKATSSGGSAFPEPKPQQQAAAPARGPAPDLIDFFSSIEQNQQPMAQNQYQQPQFNGQMPQQQTAYQQQPQSQPQANPFMQQATGMPMQQQGFSPQSPSGTNPFLQMQQQQALQQQHTQFQPQQQQIQPPNPGQFSGAPQGYQPHQPRFTTGLTSIPQSNVASFQQQQQLQQQPQPQPQYTGMTDASSQQSTNPFRQSMLNSTPTASSLSSFTTASNSPMSSQPTGNNPFARPVSSQQSQQFGGPSPFAQQPINNSPFGQPNQQQQPQQQQQQHQQPSPFQPQQLQQQQQQPNLMAQPTGTNPFARQDPAQQQQGFSQGLMPTATGATNPFRQSAFVNQNTGMGWQNSAQGTIGGIPTEQVGTVPIFPRPGM
jgi:hypothetical protein